MEGREDGGDVDVGIKEGKEEGFMDGAEEEVGTKEGGEEIVGEEDNVGSNEMDGTADGTPRVGSHGISILL